MYGKILKNPKTYVSTYFIDNSTIFFVCILMLLALQAGKKFGSKRRQIKVLQNSQDSFDFQCSECLTMFYDRCQH